MHKIFIDEKLIEFLQGWNNKLLYGYNPKKRRLGIKSQ